jgi:hypothetical protein
MTRPPAKYLKRRRLRTYPKQAYLSLDELEALEALLEARGCTFSELVRRWILRGQAKKSIRSPNPATTTDPRQLQIEGADRGPR